MVTNCKGPGVCVVAAALSANEPKAEAETSSVGRVPCEAHVERYFVVLIVLGSVQL